MKKKIPPVVPPEHVKAFEDKREFMKSIFEHDSLVPPLEPIVDEENVFVKYLLEDHHLVEEDFELERLCEGIRVVDAGYLRNQAVANKREMSLKKVLGKKYMHLLRAMPSNTQFEHQPQNA